MNWTVEEVKQADDVKTLEQAVNANDKIDVKVGHESVGQNDYAVYDGETLVGISCFSRISRTSMR